MKKVIALILFAVLLPIANAQLITIGVMPSKVELDFFKARSYKLQLFLWNSKGEVNAIFTLKPDDCLKNIIEYPKEVLVKKNTTISNPVKINITFKPDYGENKTCYLNILARPEGANETVSGVAILPSIGVKIKIIQPKNSSYYSNSQIPSVINLTPTMPRTNQSSSQTSSQHQQEQNEEISGEYEETGFEEKEKAKGEFPIWLVPVFACVVGIGAFFGWKLIEKIIYGV